MLDFRAQLNKVPLYLTCFILGTVPFLFGAVHPIVYSSYVVLVLVGLGGWLCCMLPDQQSDLRIKDFLPLILLLVFISFQSLPLPLFLIELLSPARAMRVEMVNSLAQTQQQFVSLSDHGLLSLPQVGLLLALLIYFFSLRLLMNKDDKFYRVVFLIMIAVGIIEALYGLFQFLSPRVGILWLPIKSRAAYGTIIYKNQYASLLNMCWPLAMAGVAIGLRKLEESRSRQSRHLKMKERMRRMSDIEKHVPLYFLATGIMLLAVLFSLSRGGIIAMVLVMILLNSFLPFSRKAKTFFWGLFLFFVLCYGSLLGLDTLVTRFDSIGGSGATRIETYLASLPMLWDHWLSGIGLGSFSLLSPVYLKGFSQNMQWNELHNEFLQLTIELGIPAAALFFSWLAWTMFFAGKNILGEIRIQTEQMDATIIIGAAAFCGLMGFFIHGLADFGWRLPANLFYAVTLASLVSYALDQEKLKKPKVTSPSGQ